MLTKQEATIKLTVPAHVRDTATSWALSDLNEESDAVLAALDEELCSNGQLPAYVAGLVPD
ncbi:hypothetical protein [Pseudonocardia charpentierae]|uniref:Uncharacterized protein n=1 Tax=Pseudonocardia charpentierae TaxID=3075545 RepID=A0ABU2NGL0_9PSEU|nr:hypothetical protein [Pseudonocardia sp. DSM 45834]MDT0353105.1 hypothetical protein [Pseudonocardia sp. DSM 45834]